MLRQIQQVLRSVLLLETDRRHHGAGGLLVLIWTDKASQSLNCTVAAAGLWCAGMKTETLRPVLAASKEGTFPCVWPNPQSDPEELCAFTDLHGPLRLLLSFQTKEAPLFSPGWCVRIEAFLRAFSLANAGISIHLKFKFSQQTIQRTFSAKIKSKVTRAKQPSLILDVTCDTPPPDCVSKGRWCEGGHPVIGGRLPLSIPPEAMDQGLFGELSIQLVTFLSPCLLHYPNISTKLTHIQVLLYNPSNVPVIGPSTFFQNLPAYLDCWELGVQNLLCSSSKDFLHSGGALYTVMHENWGGQEQESSAPSIQQSLRLLMFLQHSDQFACQLSDVVATEALIEHHLEDILSNNKRAVTAAVQMELKKILKVQNRRKRDQEKLHSAAEVILSSSISIVSCSSNMDFRNACLNSMKVHDTHELSASLRESLRTATSWKFIPRSRCFPAHLDELSETDESTRTEM